MPTVISGYVIKAVTGVGIRWAHKTLHLPVLSDGGRIVTKGLSHLLGLSQYLEIHHWSAFNIRLNDDDLNIRGINKNRIRILFQSWP